MIQNLKAVTPEEQIKELLPHYLKCAEGLFTEAAAKCGKQPLENVYGILSSVFSNMAIQLKDMSRPIQ